MKEIDPANWDRREHFEFFSAVADPSYSICFALDVTNYYESVKKEGTSFYYGLVYASTVVLNQIEDFRYRIRGKKIVLHDTILPSFTDLKSGSELFHITTMPMEDGESRISFSKRAARCSQEQTLYFPPEWEGRDDVVYYSCVPWISFTGLTNEGDHNPDDAIPRITWGKYQMQNGKRMLPYSMQVNHRLLDGIALGKFVEQLQNYLDR